MKYELIEYFPGDAGKTTCQLCGAIHIHQYIIKNTETEEEIETGSQCAAKLLRIPEKQVKKLAEELKHKKEKEQIYTRKYNKKSIEYIEISGADHRKILKLADEMEQKGFWEEDRKVINKHLVIIMYKPCVIYGETN